MAKYRVIAKKVIFGVGMRLKLTEAQSSIRVLSLIKRNKDVFEVRHPVEFKQGEVIEIVGGNISRVLENALQVYNADKQTPQQEAKTKGNSQSNPKAQDNNSKKILPNNDAKSSANSNQDKNSKLSQEEAESNDSWNPLSWGN